MLKRKIVQHLFNFFIFIKGIDGLIELLGGLVFILLKKEVLIRIISHIFHYDLFDIPNKVILKWVTAISNALTTNVQIFISIVLIGSGLIKMVISFNLLRRKIAIFPIAIGFLLLLYIYQIIQMFYTPSIFMYLFNLFDAIVILVIYLEYRHLKKNREFRS